MTDKSRQCINCRHFSRDFNRMFTRGFLERTEIGYCMYEPPKPLLVPLADVDKMPLTISLPPVVDEEMSCSNFDSIQNTENANKEN